MKTLIASIFSLLLVALPAHAYYYRTCDGNKIDWQTNTVILRALGLSFDWQPAQDAINREITRFNFNPSKMRIGVTHGHNDIGMDNDKSEIWASVNQDLLEQRSGVTFTWYKCTNSKSEILETDIVLQADPASLKDDKDFDWTFSDDRASLRVYGGDNRAIRATMMHEIGHVAGLLHTIETYGVMGHASRHANTNANKARVYLGEDASSGVVKLYGTASENIEDVGVSHWKFVSAGDDPKEDYSEHNRTVVYDNDGDLIEDTSNKNSEIHYKVKKGQSIKVEFTYENNGQDEHELEVGFFLSGNNTITTGDLFLRDSKVTIARNSAYTTSKTVTIPAWVPSGFYFVGAIIDYDKKLSEQTGSNNTTYIGIRVLKAIDEI